MRVLSGVRWRTSAAAHRARLDDLVGPYLERRAHGSSHPVIDFLFTYYGHKPAQLRRWHPGYGIGLADAAEYRGARGYRHVVTDSGTDCYSADPAYLGKRRDTVAFVAQLLRATASRPAHLSCFGLHEWAMVYRTEDIRHQKVPLRLGHAGTDAVLDSMQLRCTHFDAYRFFTPDAVGRNAEPLTRADQLRREQPGCLHANMDLYKWGFKLVPLISSDLLLDCFELACAARELDMRASPYDLSEFGYEPVRIETPSGRAEYVRAQSELAQRAAGLRRTFLGVCQHLLSAHLDSAALGTEPTQPR
ncbi:3-methyladenine DNA glycosylase [Nocardia sp. CDC186]|uniref:3-methyladenine DNA glycosylase n=1 Tax=Nocardia implantans TaxID=3108168 RepID=A0ABU6AR71_9NOCA|nr:MULTISPECIES: 3-methyladenine DNA glycosylase [unclassified Nocardia]MEA3528279.1 3-methyladenine DNA glycosylase [Nocardia sp. CDC192]MEB3509971.1 3-methyladenine DNA glycosylase [Nocardia sp. CDC186]